MSPSLTRRRLLTVGLASTALLSLGGGLGWLTLGYAIGAQDVAIGLSTKEMAIVRAIVGTLLAAEDDLPSGLELGVHQRIDEEVWSIDTDTAADFRSALHLLEHLPITFGFSGRFTHLSADQQATCFRAFLTSETTVVIQAAVGLKQMCHLYYYANEQTWAALGYDGPWVNFQRPPPSSDHYASLLAAGRTS